MYDRFTGVVDCAGQILAKEGPLSFWRGFTAYYGRCAPHAMIILLSIEQVTAVYRSTFLDGNRESDRRALVSPPSHTVALGQVLYFAFLWNKNGTSFS